MRSYIRINNVHCRKERKCIFPRRDTFRLRDHDLNECLTEIINIRLDVAGRQCLALSYIAESVAHSLHFSWEHLDTNNSATLTCHCLGEFELSGTIPTA